MTNGEKIKEIFPRTPTGVRLDVYGSDGTMTFTVTQDFWNAEYKEPTTKNDLGVDCIDRAEVLKLMKDNWHTHNGDWAMQESMDDIRALPSVTPQEPRKGHWIERHDDWGSGIITDRRYKCSVCHGKHIDPETGEWHEVFDYKYPFCPNCGAKMAESEESEEV